MVSLTGAAHFVVPRLFDPVNRLGFPARARTFTYVNGGLETLMGLLMAIPRTRRLSTLVSACYVAYLTIAILLAQFQIRRGRR
ncbi:DoxX-like family protein [Mycobacterium sp. GA-1199]|uniref:DoxX-like family protein n=1 Tax=Mycobacterium sp. GA-1199 TaxID=1772287 RepID=UPI001E50C8FC|nr:DoxX-like family protein [Mycobacterium sp. GA-1199]